MTSGDALDPEQVERTARLARLRVTEGEARSLAREMAAVLAHFEEVRRRVEAADAGPIGGETPAGEGEGSGGLRPDQVRPDALRIPPGDMAPEWRDGHFVVPRLPALGTRPDAGDGTDRDGCAR